MNIKHIVCTAHAGDRLVCPWQFAPLMDNFLRPLVHNPRRLFKPYVREGMTVLDVGCGAGFASLGLAELVGEEGLVISADLQPKMLEMVKKRLPGQDSTVESVFTAANQTVLASRRGWISRWHFLCFMRCRIHALFLKSSTACSKPAACCFSLSRKFT